MIPKHSHFILLLAAILWGSAPLIFSSAVDDDRTLAPYFFIPGEDETVDRLPLKSTDVDVKISGVIAEVVLKQASDALDLDALAAVTGMAGFFRFYGFRDILSRPVRATYGMGSSQEMPPARQVREEAFYITNIWSHGEAERFIQERLRDFS